MVVCALLIPLPYWIMQRRAVKELEPVTLAVSPVFQRSQKCGRRQKSPESFRHAVATGYALAHLDITGERVDAPQWVGDPIAQSSKGRTSSWQLIFPQHGETDF